MASDGTSGGGKPQPKGSDGSPAPDTSWRATLRTERLRVGLTQAELAARAGIDTETVRKYERGTRAPSRESLERILDVLQVPVGTRHRVLLDRGFHHPDFRYPLDRTPGYYFEPDELDDFVAEVPWPQLVGNELGEVVAANAAMERLWDVDLAAENVRRGRARMNLFVAMAEPQYAARIANWDELARSFIALLKAVPASATMMDAPGALFEEIIGAIGAANPAILMRLFGIWESTPARDDKVRWMYPVVWREPGFPDITFRGIVNPASEPLGLAFNDWYPVDAASHAAFEALLASRAQGGVPVVERGATAGRRRR